MDRKEIACHPWPNSAYETIFILLLDGSGCDASTIKSKSVPTKMCVPSLLLTPHTCCLQDKGVNTLELHSNSGQEILGPYDLFALFDQLVGTLPVTRHYF